MQRRRISVLLLFVIVLFLAGCTDNIKQPKTVERILKPIKTESLNKQRVNLSSIKPIVKKISILDLKHVTLFAKGISYKDAIMEILKPNGINVAFDSDLDNYVNNPNIDVALDNVTLREALNTITKIVGVAWQDRNRTIWITPFETKVYDLGLLGIIRQSSTSLGGDVLGQASGGSSETTTTPLTGAFNIRSQSISQKGDIYKIIQSNVKAMLSKNGSLTLDPASGILIVRDRPMNVALIDKYINSLIASLNRQVMIEAKIIEVELNSDWKTGIDWNVLIENPTIHQVINLGQKTIQLEAGETSNFNFSINRIINTPHTHLTLNAVINALSVFGRVKLIAEPHLRVMNDQPAILSVGRSISFIKSIEVEEQTTGTTTTQTPTVDISSIFDGIVFGITPFIRKDNTVLLRIVPIQSKLISLDDKHIGNDVYTLPQVALREASTVVSARSGDVIVLGGLISREAHYNYSGVPVFSKIPILGDLFRQKQYIHNNVELVILLKPVIIPPNE